MMAAFAICISLSSCSNNDNPAMQFADALDKMSSEIEKVQNTADLEKFMTEIDKSNSQIILEDNKDYVLTDADRKAIKDAMVKLLKVSMAKSIELTGNLEQQLSDEELDMYARQIEPHIDNAKTLGDLDGVQ